MAKQPQRSIRKPRDRRIFLDLLRDLRKQQELTQGQLGKSIGAKQAFVSKYETGERRLDFLDLLAICDALGISVVKFAERFENVRKSRSIHELDLLENRGLVGSKRKRTDEDVKLRRCQRPWIRSACCCSR